MLFGVFGLFKSSGNSAFQHPEMRPQYCKNSIFFPDARHRYFELSMRCIHMKVTVVQKQERKNGIVMCSVLGSLFNIVLLVLSSNQILQGKRSIDILPSKPPIWNSVNDGNVLAYKNKPNHYTGFRD
jgi:hypothetical protein